MDNTLEGRLLFAQNAITNALNYEQVKNLLAEFGYTDERLLEGRQLYETASDLQLKQQKEYGEQFEATDTLNAAKATANQQYVKHLKIARIALAKNRNAEESLQLTGRRKRTLSGWLKQVKAFYANALASQEVLAALGQYGITEEKLTTAQQQVTEVEQAFNRQLQGGGKKARPRPPPSSAMRPSKPPGLDGGLYRHRPHRPGKRTAVFGDAGGSTAGVGSFEGALPGVGGVLLIAFRVSFLTRGNL